MMRVPVLPMMMLMLMLMLMLMTPSFPRARSRG